MPKQMKAKVGIKDHQRTVGVVVCVSVCIISALGGQHSFLLKHRREHIMYVPLEFCGDDDEILLRVSVDCSYVDESFDHEYMGRHTKETVINFEANYENVVIHYNPHRLSLTEIIIMISSRLSDLEWKYGEQMKEQI